jgi:hypothetical protein
MDQQLNRAPPAVLIYHGIADCWPKRAFWEEIGRRVGDDPDDLQFWEQVVKEYLFCGWNKLNVRAMLEFFGRREVPPGNGRGRSAAAGWVDPIAAVEEAIREQGWD